MYGELRTLEARLTRGMAVLDSMERSGDAGPRYERALRHWLELLAAYELQAESVVDAPVAAAAGL